MALFNEKIVPPLTREQNFDAEDRRNVQPLERVEPEVYPTGIRLALLLASIYFAIFLVALDRTIIATALPKITDDFRSFNDIGWYNGAFTLTTCAFMPFFGRVYTFYSPKWVFLALVVVFEAGSAVCGAAPNSIVFICGRAIAGLGASGLFNGALILIVYAGPLHKRAMYMGFISAIFGVASIAGPLLGGVFTTKVSWRWCFYTNLPIGAVCIAFLILVLPATPPAQPGLTLRQHIARLDLPGTAVLLPCVVCILLALQWGGQQYSWSDSRVIALLVLFGVLAIVFISIQIWQQDRATIPPRIMKQRSVIALSWYAFFMGSVVLLPIYYISIYFQAVKGDSAVLSGIKTLPLLLAFVLSSITAGISVMRIGYYKPFMIVSAVLTPISLGVLTLFKTTTKHPLWIGAQIFFGLAIGCGYQQINVAVQAVLPKEDGPVGISLVYFMQVLGPTIFVAVSQNILDDHLTKKLAGLNTFTPQQIVNTGASQLRHVFPASELQYVLQVYNEALVQVFYVGIAASALTILGALAVTSKNIKQAKTRPALTVSTDEEQRGIEKEDKSSSKASKPLEIKETT